MSDPDAGAAEGRCQRCGTPVSHRFRRVFGGNDATVHGCIECMTLSELCEGAAAEQAASPTAQD